MEKFIIYDHIQDGSREATKSKGVPYNLPVGNITCPHTLSYLWGNGNQPLRRAVKAQFKRVIKKLPKEELTKITESSVIFWGLVVIAQRRLSILNQFGLSPKSDKKGMWVDTSPKTTTYHYVSLVQKFVNKYGLPLDIEDNQ